MYVCVLHLHSALRCRDMLEAEMTLRALCASVNCTPKRIERETVDCVDAGDEMDDKQTLRCVRVRLYRICMCMPECCEIYFMYRSVIDAVAALCFFYTSHCFT